MSKNRSESPHRTRAQPLPDEQRATRVDRRSVQQLWRGGSLSRGDGPVATAYFSASGRVRDSALFAITSSDKDDGKTALALSFALSAGTIGRKVLLIDLDFRNPSIAHSLEGFGKDRATYFREETVPAEEIVKTIAEFGIDFLPLSCRREYALAFLSTNQLTIMLDHFKDQYDCIVIASPPLLGATEARVIASVVDNVILALEWSATEVDVARRAISQLGHVGIKDANERVFGVLTQVNMRKHHFGFSIRRGDVKHLLTARTSGD